MINEILKTERLVLRELTPDDEPDLAEIFTDPATMAFYPAPFERKKVAQWIDWCQVSYRTHGYGLWAMVLERTGECIGDCGISIQRIDGEELPEIGFHVKRRYWGNGYATEAAVAVRDYGFASFGFPRLYCYMDVENVASRRVAEKCGMRYMKEFDKRGAAHAVYCVDMEGALKVP